MSGNGAFVREFPKEGWNRRERREQRQQRTGKAAFAGVSVISVTSCSIRRFVDHCCQQAVTNDREWCIRSRTSERGFGTGENGGNRDNRELVRLPLGCLRYLRYLLFIHSFHHFFDH